MFELLVLHPSMSSQILRIFVVELRFVPSPWSNSEFDGRVHTSRFFFVGGLVPADTDGWYRHVACWDAASGNPVRSSRSPRRRTTEDKRTRYGCEQCFILTFHHSRSSRRSCQVQGHLPVEVYARVNIVLLTGCVVNRTTSRAQKRSCPM